MQSKNFSCLHLASTDRSKYATAAAGIASLRFDHGLMSSRETSLEKSVRLIVTLIWRLSVFLAFHFSCQFLDSNVVLRFPFVTLLQLPFVTLFVTLLVAA